MKETLYILISMLFFSCSEKAKKNESENRTIKEQIVSTKTNNSDEPIEIVQQEKEFNEFLKSIKAFEIQPIDTLRIDYEIQQLEKVKIGKNIIQIFKKDSFNIDWIKINANKFTVGNLKTINPRIDGECEKMFCNSLQRVKLYKFNKSEIIFLEFTSHPCTGLGCSVSDYLIYDVKNNQVNLFGNFRTADLEFYDFPFDKRLNYISTEYKGNFHAATSIHFISRIYFLDNKGKFQLKKDLKGKEYYYEVITYPNEENRDEYKRNWFKKNRGHNSSYK